MSVRPTASKLSRRRLLLSGAAIFGGAVVLQACGQATPTPAPSSQQPAAQNPTPAANQSGSQPTAAPAQTAPQSGSVAGEVRWQNRGNDIALKAEQEFVEKTFAQQFPNIKVTIEPAPDGRDEKLIAAMVGGNAPDVFESWTDNVTQYADRGQVEDVEPYVKRDFTEADLEDFYEWQWRDFVLPSNIRFGVPKYVNLMFTWINKDAFDKAGVAIPDQNWTHDDYAALANQLTIRNGDQIVQSGLFYPVWSWDRFWYKIEAWGGQVVDPNDTTKALFDSDVALEAFEWSRKLMWDDRAMMERLLLSPQGQSFNSQELFAAGKFAMAEDGFYPFNMARAVQKKINWQYVHTPTGPAGRRVLGTTDGYVMWKGSKVKDAAWELMKFVSGPEFQEERVRVTGALPVRFSVLDKWKAICIETFPELEAVNLDVAREAMEMGYPGNRILFAKDAEARKIMVPALEKVYISGGTPVSYFKDIAKEITEKMRE